MRRLHRLWHIVCWGPIEALSNGYFVRTYTLAESIIKYLRMPLMLAEYSEGLDKKYAYELRKISQGIMKVLLPGNEESKNIVHKYLKFFLYQLVNTIRLQNFLRLSKVTVISGELFLPTLIVMKTIIRRDHEFFIIVDPQMLISEREKRRGRKLITFLLLVLEMLFFRLSDFAIAISEEMKKKIVNMFKVPQERVIIIPHALPSKFQTPIVCISDYDRFRGVHSITKLVFVGSLRTSHNVEAVLYLIRVLSILKEYIKKPVILYVIGSVDDKTKCFIERFVSKCGLEGVVNILGFIEDLDDFICRNADILLAPMFTMSGVSTKMLYYLRFKDKVIITSKEAIEGIEHLAARHSRVIVAEDSRDFARKLLEVINNV